MKKISGFGIVFPKNVSSGRIRSQCKSHSNFFQLQVIGVVFDSSNYDFYSIGFLHS